MSRRLSSSLVVLVLIVCACSCLAYTEKQREEYGVLMSAVTFSAEKVIGVYGEHIPNDFSQKEFMNLVKSRIPSDYYGVLEKYPLKIEPRETYYLLMVLDPETKDIILFDYSCTPKVDGPVLLDPVKYDINKIDSFDKCNPQTLH